MLFSSIPFLYYFLPLVLAVYFLVPRGLKNAVLFASSLLFYAWGEPRFCPVSYTHLRTACAQNLSLWRCIGRMDSCIFRFRFKMATERMRPPCRFRCRAKLLMLF